MIYTNKDIPISKVIATLLTLTANGTTGAVTNQGAAVLDLTNLSDDNYHQGVLLIEGKTTNGQIVQTSAGPPPVFSTPTSPGSGKTYTLKYAFSEDLISTSDAPTVLAGVATSVTITLPDSAVATAAGQKYHQSARISYAGRYLYTWYDRDAFAASAYVNVTISLKRL